MNLRARLVFLLGLLGLLCLMLPRSLRAQTVYTYTGNPYTFCSGTYCINPAPAISITLVVQPVIIGVPRPLIGNLTQYVSAVSMTDGTGLCCSNLNDLYAAVNFDNNGNIVTWNILGVSTNAAGTLTDGIIESSYPCGSNVAISENPPLVVDGVCDLSETGPPGTNVVGYGYNHDPGKWTKSTVLVLPHGGLGLAQRLHLVAGPVTPSPSGPVELNLGFADFNGNPIGPSITTQPLSVGETASLDLDADAPIRRLGGRIEVQPVVTVVQVPGTPPASPTLTIATEVRDNLTGIGTVLASAIVASSGQPSFVPQGLGGGETMRLTAFALQPEPQPANYAPTPCVAVLSFADKSGNPVGPRLPVNLSPGNAASLDLDANSLGIRFGQSTDIQPVVTLTPPQTGGPALINSACYASSEVYDRLTGRTHTHQAASTTALPTPPY